MDLNCLFKPKRVAVIGVSLHNDQHPANIIFYKNLLRYPAETFSVNPKAGILKGRPAFTNVKDIPGKIDMAVIAARADNVPSIVQDCIDAGVGGATIISGGFAEVGNADLQKRLVDMAREADFPFIGPNCLGIFSPGHVDTFFFSTERMGTPKLGNVAMISQSGGMLVDQMIRFTTEGVGMSLGLSIGNKAMLKEKDLLSYLAKDEQTKVIAFYVEGFGQGEGREFLEAARDCGKPVVVLKTGKTAGGSRAVSSHTASLAGDYQIFSAILGQHGIVEARGPLELQYYCQALSAYSEVCRGRIGIVSGSGGHGAMATDMCLQMGLEVNTLSPLDQENVRRQLSPSIKEIATCSNPVDLTGSSADDDFVAAANAMGESRDIDVLLLLLLPYFPGCSPDLGAMLSQVALRHNKPMVAYVPRLDKYRMLIEGFEIYGVPVAHSIEGAVHMAAALKRYGQINGACR